MGTILTIIFAWLMADFIVGFVHWYEDRCLNEKSTNKIVREILRANDLHHTEPMAMTKLSLWENLNTSFYIGMPVVVISFFVNAPHVVTLAFFIACFGNLFHKWSHLPKQKLNIFIRGAMALGLIQTRAQHRKHHYDNKGIILRKDARSDYCVMTPYLNPILDKIQFFKTLEKILR